LFFALLQKAWVVKALFPSDKEAGKQEWECYPTPEKRLAQQPVKKRIQKSVRNYENNKRELQSRWFSIVQELTEAKRFQDEFLQEVQRQKQSAMSFVYFE